MDWAVIFDSSNFKHISYVFLESFLDDLFPTTWTSQLDRDPVFC